MTNFCTTTPRIAVPFFHADYQGAGYLNLARRPSLPSLSGFEAAARVQPSENRARQSFSFFYSSICVFPLPWGQLTAVFIAASNNQWSVCLMRQTHGWDAACCMCTWPGSASRFLNRKTLAPTRLSLFTAIRVLTGDPSDEDDSRNPQPRRFNYSTA